MKKIYINPGHSDKDPGAVGYETERRLNVAVSLFMNDYLLANYVCETRMNPGTMGTLTAVCNDANSWGADLFVSNHFNAGGGDGYEALVYNQKRVELGRIFEKYVKETGQNSRGVKLRPGLTVLSKTNMPAIMNEGAFVDNLKDIQDWNEDAEMVVLGIAYAKAAAEFLKLEAKPQPKPEPAPVSRYTLSLRPLAKGDTGEDVKALQNLLNAAGSKYNIGTADGIFGAKTDAAVRAYQRDKKLTVDGIAGAATMGTLLGVA